MESKVQRCMERAPEGENLTKKEIESQIKRVDKSRGKIREILSDQPWGERSAYHLTVNTTDWNLKLLSRAVSAMATGYFEQVRLTQK